MRFIFLSLFLSVLCYGRAQEMPPSDPKFLEDQFYMGITYNFLLNKPTGITQRNLSYGMFGGFIKDIPINKARTRALGIGLGYGIYSYYSNMLATETGNGPVYSALDGAVNYKRNKFENHLLEVPLEYRWRNATSSEYKFWRIYGGFKVAYAFTGGRSKFVAPNDKASFYNTDLRKLQYGLTFNFGYNTFNVHIYYSLNKSFNNAVFLNGEEIGIKPLRVGLIFYIL